MIKDPLIRGLILVAATIIATVAAILVLYYVMSPYQKCMGAIELDGKKQSTINTAVHWCQGKTSW